MTIYANIVISSRSHPCMSPPLCERARPSVRLAVAGGVRRRRRREVVGLNDDDLVGVGFSDEKHFCEIIQEEVKNQKSQSLNYLNFL